jgi:hypothetical protein
LKPPQLILPNRPQPLFPSPAPLRPGSSPAAANSVPVHTVRPFHIQPTIMAFQTRPTPLHAPAAMTPAHNISTFRGPHVSGQMQGIRSGASLQMQKAVAGPRGISENIVRPQASLPNSTSLPGRLNRQGAFSQAPPVSMHSSALQLMKKSKSQRKHEKKLKTQSQITDASGIGSVTCGRKTWACFNVSYDASSGYISANFSKPWPKRSDIPVDSGCVVTLGANQYNANLFQMDINPSFFTRGNFNNVSAK